MKIVKPNLLGYNHDVVIKKFEGNLSFVNEFCVYGEYQPSAVYKAATPDKSKGHKRYMLLTTSIQDGQSLMYVRGMSTQKIQQFRYQGALHCLTCDEVIYSINRHHFMSCSCQRIAVDGGKDYFKVVAHQDAKYRVVTLDLLTDTIIDLRGSNGKVRTKEEKETKKVKPRIPIAPPGRRHASKKDYKRVKRVDKQSDDE